MWFFYLILPQVLHIISHQVLVCLPHYLIVANITCVFLFSLKDALGQRNNLIKLFLLFLSYSMSLCVFFIFRLCFQITSIFVMLVIIDVVVACVYIHIVSCMLFMPFIFSFSYSLYIFIYFRYNFYCCYYDYAREGGIRVV